MVRTRLSDSHEDAIESFLPQRTRSGKRNSRSEPEEAVSTIQDGHLYHSPRNRRNKIFDMSPGSSRNSKNSVSPVFHTTRRQSYLKHSEEDDTPRTRSFTVDTEEDGKMSRRTRRRAKLDQDTPNMEEDVQVFKRGRSGRRSLYSSGEKKKSEPQEAELRRSSRRKKPIYSTMDQKLLGDLQLTGGLDMYSWPTGKRSPSPEKEEEADDGEDSKEEEEEEDSGDNDDQKDELDEEMERLDMYSRVKQRHIQAKKMREERQRLEEEERLRKEQEDEEEEEESAEETSDDDEDESDDEETSEEESERETRGKNYHLRQHRAPTKRFEVPVEVPMPRRRKSELEDVFGIPNSPIRRRYPKTRKHLTPIRSPRFKRRKHHATHHSSSTSSEGSDDERRFERRKSKSMAKARMRCLPMNLTTEDATSGARRDRQKIGSSLADVDPMNIDSSVTFENVGGLNKHIQSLKEMVVFPLLYPEVFSKFKITPPRGVLFHGPPGTGKTLVARALANECRSGDKRVAFFMRKGADCLSKWVGESERQLRLLFDQAYTMRPSIIFFDEIDGLAPVRSSRQDQIHSSIVSTLLALMDGLDSRGEVVVIGATNRIDSIDPALRRPGRFDREFLFQLPSCERVTTPCNKARKSILSIHTKEWNPKLSDSFLAEVAEKCVGYCGADLKALCTETALYALRHQFPQIYASKEKLLLDLSQIQVSARDFHLAMQTIVPAAQRAVVSPGRALSITVKHLLQGQLNFILDKLKNTFPIAFNRKTSVSQDNGHSDPEDVVSDLLNGDVFDDDEGPCIFVTPTARKKRKTNDGEAKSFLNFSSSAFSAPSAFRPRLLLAGDPDQGHSTHVAPGVLHRLEGLPIHCLDLPTLYAVSAKNPEESCAQVFREARRTAPSVIYMPHIVQWWQASGYTLQATFLTLLHDLPPNAPILLLATADCSLPTIPVEICNLFSSPQEVYTMRNPTSDERKAFFTDLFLVEAAKAPPQRKKLAAKALEVLPVALPSEPQALTNEEETKLRETEEATLRELRIFLRDVLSRLAMERKFRSFAKAVDPEEVPDYFAVIKNPMDLSTMMNKINMHEYICAKDFLQDIDLITSNALEYNPDRDPSDRQIRNYACELKDMAYAIIDAEMDSDFEQMCVDITKSRAARGDVVKTKDAPSFYRTLPQLQRQQAQEAAKRNPTPYRRLTTPRVRTPGSPLRSSKKRRKSAWARGCIPKPKKYPKKKEEEEEKEDEKEDDDNETVENGEENGEGEGEEIEKDNEGSDENKTEIDDKEMQEDGSDSSNEGELQIDVRVRDESVEGGDKDGSETLTNGRDGSSGDDDNESVKSAVVGKADSRRELEKAASPHQEMVNGDIEDESSREGMGNGKDESSNDGGPDEERRENGGDEERQRGERVRNIDEATTPITTNVEVSLRRVTRRMLADANATRAVEILEEPTPDLVVDKERLGNLLQRLVSVTSNWTVSRLEKLHCQLSQCVYRHRMRYNKTQLIQDMEDEVSQASLTAMQT